MILIGEKINGSIPAVKKAIAEKDEAYICNLAKIQAETGIDYIDVCASIDESIEVDTMKWLIDLVQKVTETPIAVDSPSARVCAESLTFCNKPGLVNSVSGEGDKIDVVFPVIAGTKWECIALLCDDSGIPQTAEKRLQVLEQIMKRAAEYKIDPSRLHIDPLVEMLCTSEDGISMVTEVIKEIKNRYPAIHITGAVSNISFNLPARKLVNQGFVVLAMNAGMDSAILDPLNRDMMGMIYATEALLGMDEYCIEYIGKFRKGIFGKK